MNVVLETDRLVLRELTLDDAPDLDVILGDAVTMKYYPRPYTPLEVEGWIVKNIERYRTYGFGLWALIRKDDGVFVGQCGLVPQRVEGTAEVEVGWHVRRTFWRRGYASEAAAAVRDYGFGAFALDRLVSLVLPANVPSQGVARKIGMIPERIVTHGGQDHLLFVAPAGEPDEIARTRASYDLIADEYASVWGTRSEASRRGRARFEARVPDGGLVVDVGCGPGRDIALLGRAGLRVVGIDSSLAMARRAAAAGPVIAADMRRLPVPDGVFDGVWASASLLHVPARAAPGVIIEFRRVLRPGGTLFVSVKLGEGEAWGARHRQPRFFTFYSDARLNALIESGGFTIEEGWLEDDVLGREPWLNRIARRR